MSESNRDRDGGPAFPQIDPDPNGESIMFEGKSMRDYFAASALQGLIASQSGDDVGLPNPDFAADWAFRYADAMLEARER